MKTISCNRESEKKQSSDSYLPKKLDSNDLSARNTDIPDSVTLAVDNAIDHHYATIEPQSDFTFD